MNLEVGCYIIKPQSGRASNKCHYLRVFIENKNKYVQIDDGTPQQANEDMQILLKSYTLVKRTIYHNSMEKSLEKRLKRLVNKSLEFHLKK